MAEQMTEQSLIERIIQTTGDLPSMPYVANLVMEKISDPNATAKDIHQIISKDQALAARVLRIANSAFYGLSRTVTRLSDAIVVMGFSSIRSLVMTSVLKNFFKEFGLTEKLLWEHSLVAAYAAKRISKAIRFMKVEEAFLAGLMHDIGKVILNLKMPDKMLEIVQEVYNSPGASFAQIETDMFGFTHADVGKLIARKWNFAKEIEEAIGYHHRPKEATELPALAYLVNVANAFCHKLEVGPTKNPHLDIAEMESAKILKMDRDLIEELLPEMSDAVASQEDFSTL